MEYEGLSPHLQVLAVCPYPEPDKPSSHPVYTVPKDRFKSEALWSGSLRFGWKTTPFRLPATAYLVYSQLLSISGGCSSIRNLRTPHVVIVVYTWR
jgi:hypothetical protein